MSIIDISDKVDITKLIRDSYKFADEHYEYCKNNCKFYHNNICIELSTKHNKSYVRCNSKYCIDYVNKYGFSITYDRDVLDNIKKNETECLFELTYYSDDEYEIDESL